jgi:hypothetical protein
MAPIPLFAGKKGWETAKSMAGTGMAPQRRRLRGGARPGGAGRGARGSGAPGTEMATGSADMAERARDGAATSPRKRGSDERPDRSSDEPARRKSNAREVRAQDRLAVESALGGGAFDGEGAAEKKREAAGVVRTISTAVVEERPLPAPSSPLRI